MKYTILAFWFLCSCVIGILTKQRNIVIRLDENSVCDIKNTCLDCLQLPQCSWCSTESKCFSDHLTPKKECENSTVRHIDYGMSLKENAVCSCAGGNMDRNCVSPGSPKQEECSGRGQCICGRCFCETNPDPLNPTKAVMGEYCEYDNFSCTGSKCNEGPYNINEQNLNEEDIEVAPETEISQPLEES